MSIIINEFYHVDTLQSLKSGELIDKNLKLEDRRLEFPSQLSRFEAVFGWSTIEEAKLFRRNYSNGKGAIVRVKCNDFNKKDMNLLFLGKSVVESLLFARKYWRGSQGVNPNWEVLLKTPVEVIEVMRE